MEKILTHFVPNFHLQLHYFFRGKRATANFKCYETHGNPRPVMAPPKFILGGFFDRIVEVLNEPGKIFE